MPRRDIKTENVFLCQDGRIKLGDFGLSRVLQHTLDMAQTFCGTPNYLAPEICARLPYNAKVDVWALGYGCTPFTLTRLPLPIRQIQPSTLRSTVPDRYRILALFGSVVVPQSR